MVGDDRGVFFPTWWGDRIEMQSPVRFCWLWCQARSRQRKRPSTKFMPEIFRAPDLNHLVDFIAGKLLAKTSSCTRTRKLRAARSFQWHKAAPDAGWSKQATRICQLRQTSSLIQAIFGVLAWKYAEAQKRNSACRGNVIR